MLLLGAGESGKSTVLKQMKLIHEGSYTDKERENYKEIIYSNTVQSMHVRRTLFAIARNGDGRLPRISRSRFFLTQVILDAMEISLSNGEGPRFQEVIMSQPHQIEADYLPGEVTEAIIELWKDQGVRECFGRSREYQLNDSAS
jgi:guanine nucleotide-binding protein G(i) subunit alpha